MTSLYGHAQRRAIRARTLTRAGWRELMHTLRKAARSSATYNRSALCLADLYHDMGTARADILALRAEGLNAMYGSGPADCCGLGVLRATLALKWYPLPRRAA